MKNKLLEERRKLLGYSHQDVANKVNIDRSYYTKIENGFTPSVKVAKNLGQLMEFDWTIFFTKNSVKNAQKQAI
ncbi:helix-turn-helix transcriptional regulator [Virgibacillus chiguensis]|uniref:DNA-binding transcriptional regulator, XRE-family HTH domain n=1 Tax=Virgibacillus chiguensis TaxID=411959 RepID=A0A1M5VHE6_9BACI|nr:helix-turn-helix transcriptional regulator [Virgibacillus chiguensis]SHH74657.1 DNA-binding transcriptional regulator, XRE-family HTH domain [Virgibacillus chiguensis]